MPFAICRLFCFFNGNMDGVDIGEGSDGGFDSTDFRMVEVAGRSKDDDGFSFPETRFDGLKDFSFLRFFVRRKRRTGSGTAKVDNAVHAASVDGEHRGVPLIDRRTEIRRGKRDRTCLIHGRTNDEKDQKQKRNIDHRRNIHLRRNTILSPQKDQTSSSIDVLPGITWFHILGEITNDKQCENFSHFSKYHAFNRNSSR